MVELAIFSGGRIVNWRSSWRSDFKTAWKRTHSMYTINYTVMFKDFDFIPALQTRNLQYKEALCFSQAQPTEESCSRHISAWFDINNVFEIKRLSITKEIIYKLNSFTKKIILNLLSSTLQNTIFHSLPKYFLSYRRIIRKSKLSPAFNKGLHSIHCIRL